MHTRRILIVDDEKYLRDMLRAFFEYQGFEVFEAADGIEASEKVREEPFDLVLTDLRMPGLDGLEVLKLVKSLSPETPVLVLTGYASPQSESTAIELGCDGFLSKPFTLEYLKSAVHKSLARRKAENLSR
jgi:two-component system response regulator PilR (NtrC family)